ncbi:MAG TPA: peptidoglycan DD-metalloendopeptidase family protein [Ktedonobacteraceae bacterium]|nr:peptidoglycan DD-metalloendopeptidase family protein [Ktedonobacteraceae bacterium]
MIFMRKRNYYIFASCVALLLNVLGFSLLTHAASLHAAEGIAIAQDTQTSPDQAMNNQYAVKPFMHRPFYGNRTVIERTISFFDHDKPWYAHDGIFVRYDGKKWRHTVLNDCSPGKNCYDGHNGYDINLRFEPVLSVAAGVVTRANWYNPLNHNDAFGLWVAISHSNGYATAYGHLSAITVSVGERVGIQQRIGTSGTTGSSTGPHLHLSTYYMPKWRATDPFGWESRHADPNAVPDRYLWVSQPATDNSVPVLSSRGSHLAPGAILVNDGGQGFRTTGTWKRTRGAVKGEMHWTRTTRGRATATAIWQTRLPASRKYEVGFFVNDHCASSSWVPLEIYSADRAHPGRVIRHIVHLDESHIGTFRGPFGRVSTGAQWISLGTYYFTRGSEARVAVSNATGESGQQLGVDGVEFVPVP